MLTEAEIRLAFHQGLFSHADLNRFQHWALRYSIAMQRRVALQDTEDMLQRQIWYQNPDRYQDLFLAGEFSPDPLTVAGRDMEEVVDDVDELDLYFEQLEQRRSMSGAMLADSGFEEGWQ